MTFVDIGFVTKFKAGSAAINGTRFRMIREMSRPCDFPGCSFGGTGLQLCIRSKVCFFTGDLLIESNKAVPQTIRANARKRFVVTEKT
jgi:hypothetical protein